MRKYRFASSYAFLAAASLLSACSGANGDTEASSTSNTPLSASGQATHSKANPGKHDGGRHDDVDDDSDDQGEDEHERADGGEHEHARH